MIYMCFLYKLVIVFVLQIRIIPRAMGLKILKFRPTLPLYLSTLIYYKKPQLFLPL